MAGIILDSDDIRAVLGKKTKNKSISTDGINDSICNKKYIKRILRAYLLNHAN